MASMASSSDVQQSEVLLLLQEYCSRRSRQRSSCSLTPTPGTIHYQGPALSRHKAPGRSLFTTCRVITVPTKWRHLKTDGVGQETVAERLVKINESTPIEDVTVEDQDELIQKLVELMITFGDDINQKMDQNPVLQQQLSNLTYVLFEKLTSSVQNLVQTGLTAESDMRIQQQKISWAFEVTSRLSAISVVQRRRVLSYGEQYIQQHHSDWVQLHGGWEDVFYVD